MAVCAARMAPPSAFSGQRVLRVAAEEFTHTVDLGELSDGAESSLKRRRGVANVDSLWRCAAGDVGLAIDDDADRGLIGGPVQMSG